MFSSSGGATQIWGARGRRGKLAQVATWPPPGWTVREVGLTHCEAGGATLRRWLLVVWYPPWLPPVLPAPLAPLPWFRIRSSVVDCLAAGPVRACLAPADSVPVADVVRVATDRIDGGRAIGGEVVHQWGLFPALDLSTPVLLSTVGSITGLGIRPLSSTELAAIWDVPILVSDCLSSASSEDLLRNFCL